MPNDHPHEQLAALVDGSATEEERRVAEAHLAHCAACTADVEFARRAHVALASLPELEGPGLADRGLDWVGGVANEDGNVVSVDRTRPLRARRRRTQRERGIRPWQRVAWGAGIAAAAVVAAVVVFSGLNGNSRKAATGTVPAAAPEVRGAATRAIESTTNYDPSSMNALARTLATRQTGTLSEPTFAIPSPQAAGATNKSTTTSDLAATQQATSCLQQGAGLPVTATPTYLEIADFQGKPAYIGAFPNNPSGGTPTQLLVIAVDRTTCQPLYLVTQPL